MKFGLIVPFFDDWPFIAGAAVMYCVMSPRVAGRAVGRLLTRVTGRSKPSY